MKRFISSALLLCCIHLAVLGGDKKSTQTESRYLHLSSDSNQPVPKKNRRLKTAEKEAGRTSILKKLDSIGSPKVNEIYLFTVAADVPDNKRPGKVFYKNEPGHVFLTLQKKDTITGESLSQSWGFYPVRPVSCLFLRTVKCEIIDNGNREYDAAITRQLTAEQFEFVKQQAWILTQKKYNLNKYNCYDYALELYNSIPGTAALPTLKVKFPFIFGRGGSPCGLYKVLKELSSSAHGFNMDIVMEKGKSPKSTIYSKAVNSPDSFSVSNQGQLVFKKPESRAVSIVTTNTQ